MMILHFLLLLFVSKVEAASNIVLIITDDQEYESVVRTDVMPLLHQHIVNKGAKMTNFFVSTPSCCPSRMQFFSGMYGHHSGGKGNTENKGCYSDNWKTNIEPNAFPNLLGSNYNSFFMGKYLNTFGADNVCEPNKPPGFTEFNAFKPGNEYNNYHLCEWSTRNAGSNATVYYGDGSANYSTNVMKDKVKTFLEAHKQRNARRTNRGKEETPFLMVLAPPHIKAPQPEDGYDHLFDGETAPSNTNNPSDKHYIMRWGYDETEPISSSRMTQANNKLKTRWQALQSVDALVEELVIEIESQGYSFSTDTYFMYSSDNGLHYLQNARPPGKWMNYDTDIKVPFVIRGPGIPEGSTINHPVLNIDVAPTILEMADMSIPSSMDGASFLTLVKNSESVSNWRTDFLVEYWGSGTGSKTIKDACLDLVPQLPGGGPDTGFSNCNAGNDCLCTDAITNTFTCVRNVDPGVSNYVYCKFPDDDSDYTTETPFYEVYDIETDPEQATNIYNTLTDEEKDAHESRRAQLENCESYANCK